MSHIQNETHLDNLAMSATVPVRIRDLDHFILHTLLLLQPLLSQLLTFSILDGLTFAVGEEGGVDVGILRELLLRPRRVWRQLLKGPMN